MTATPVVPCGDGGVIIGGNCYPDPQLLCGPDSVWDPMLERCRGLGGGDCSSMCSAPSGQSVCVSGHVVSFVDPTQPANAQTGVKVRVYNPIAFVTMAQPQILGETTLDDTGCYAVDGVDRAQLGSLAAVSVTDTGNPMGGTFAVVGVGSPVAAGRNVKGLQAYYIERTTVDAWAAQVSDATLGADGMWIGWFLDPTGNPVSGVTPARPGDITPSSSIYCFRGNRMTLSTEDTTDTTGLCAISPDTVEAHTGLCGGGACSPPFPSVTGGSTANVIFIEPMQQM